VDVATTAMTTTAAAAIQARSFDAREHLTVTVMHSDPLVMAAEGERTSRAIIAR
jgi:hypothetical protein